MNYDPMSPIWLQVVNQIKGDIVTGGMPPGSKLPGGRDAAVRYGINPNTAARVYQELEHEHLCYTRRGLGTFITEDTERIRMLRQDMARSAVQRFLQSLRTLGIGRDEAIEMIQEEENREYA